MLVLTTMFVGVSQTLPLTSTIKMVDIWLVFNLLIPFIEVLIHSYKVIFQNLHRRGLYQNWLFQESLNKEGLEMNKKAVTTKANGKVANWFLEKEVYNCDPKISKNRKNRICDIFGKYVVPFIAIIFMSTYWSTGLYLHYFPTKWNTRINECVNPNLS